MFMFLYICFLCSYQLSYLQFLLAVNKCLDSINFGIQLHLIQDDTGVLVGTGTTDQTSCVQGGSMFGQELPRHSLTCRKPTVQAAGCSQNRRHARANIEEESSNSTCEKLQMPCKANECTNHKPGFLLQIGRFCNHNISSLIFSCNQTTERLSTLSMAKYGKSILKIMLNLVCSLLSYVLNFS